MKLTRPIAISCLLFFMISSLVAQDTIQVQTFTFDSITTRRGVWDFPDNDQTYRRILMYYTLKCDPATTHDQYNCGEWDYLTYTKIYEHTGVYDSTLYFHPNITRINGQSIDSVALTTEPTYVQYRKQHISTSFPDTLSYEQWSSGETTEETSMFFNTLAENGRSRILYTASQLQSMGLTEGDLNGMKFLVTDGEGDINNLLVRATLTESTEVTTRSLPAVSDTLFFNEMISIAPGWMDIPFSHPFYWDGTSSILFDLAFENQNPNSGFTIVAHSDGNDHAIVTERPNYVLDFDGVSDFVKMDSSHFINDNFTMEYWVYKRNNNHWSRVFDLGNGPGKQNILMSLTTATNGKQTIAVYNDGLNESFEISEPLPLNQWTHVAIRLTFGRVAWVYYNGELVMYGPLQIPQDINRTENFLGRSNWANDSYADMMLDDFRFYNITLEQDDIIEDMYTDISDPAAEAGLVLYYDFTPNSNGYVRDLSVNQTHGNVYGKAGFVQQNGGSIIKGFIPWSFVPKVVFYRLESSAIENIDNWITYTKENTPSEFVLYDDPDDPLIPTDTTLFYESGYQYVYNPDGSIYDSVEFAREFDYILEERPYYGEPFEIINDWEIGRFITPYGINLDLGPDGFTWIYDVTDYASMLKGAVDISAGNQQELLDLRFEMIEGTPARDVLRIDRPWGRTRSRKYSALDENTAIQAQDVALLEQTMEVKLKTRLTGHGHNSNTGNYPHCCEWKDNTHYILNNADTVAAWSIWQATECPENPVYPQGGTWPGEREGWCPGDMVDDIEWELTPYIQNQSVNIDYEITDVPENNQGMGNGNYVMGFHLVEYGATKCLNDAEVFDVIAPNNFRYYSRLNPVCADPQVVIRNNGSLPLTSLQIHYGVKGGEQQTYHWSGMIDPHQKAKISLPLWGDSFWFGDDSNTFQVSVSQPNGAEDEYADNNSFETHYTMPDIYDETIVLKLKMNKQAYRYSLLITSILGDTVYCRHQMANDSIYLDTLNFPKGCYSLRLLDIENMGLSYWAYAAQGTGYMRFFDTEGSQIKNFQSEFGRSINYSFIIGNLTYIEEPGIEAMVKVYPVPAYDKVTIELDQIEGVFPCKIFRQDGALIYEKDIYSSGKSTHTIDVSDFPAGIYLLTGKNDRFNLSRKLIIRH